MKTACCLIVACWSVLMFVSNTPAWSAEGFDFGRLHRIDIRAEHPKAYQTEAGDLVQCYLDFPVVPEQIVGDLKVTIAGKSVMLVGTVNTSRPQIVGSGQVSAFLMPRQPGLSTLTIQPVIPGQSTKPIEINFQVRLPEEP